MGGIVVWVNGISIEEYGARLKADYEITAVPLENQYFQGTKRSNFVLLSQTYGLKSIKMNFDFMGNSRGEIDTKKSIFDGNLIGTLEIMLDGYFYTVICNKLGDGVYYGDYLMECEYEFEGYKHGELTVIGSNVVWCESTAPYTDCILSATVSEAASSYQLGTVTFKGVLSGDYLVVDGINKRILINGAPAAQKADWVRFPSLVPGENLITCDDPVTVEFYQVYF